MLKEHDVRTPQPGTTAVAMPTVSLLTPSKRRSHRRLPNSPASPGLLAAPACNTSNAATNSATVACSADSSPDCEETPRLPDDWLLLEYELLEHVDALPRAFTDRMASELKAQAQHLGELRSMNTKLRAAARSQTAGAAPASEVDASSGAAEARASCSSRESTEKAGEPVMATALAEGARRLESRARYIKEAAEHEMQVISQLRRAHEEQTQNLRAGAAEDAARRRRLREATAEVSWLRCRVVHLEATRRHAEARTRRREQEDQRLDAELVRLRAEVARWRARGSKAPEPECMLRVGDDSQRQAVAGRFAAAALGGA
mmetsp:Transcript_117673/g.228780  ORF Transcript_117673/g.228780 Transcript_117673/m.228780 type:complete len:317 (+) Transcript_117673:94-1044(+)